MGLSTRILVMSLGRSSNKRRVSSINFVNAAGLRAQDSAFVGLSNFPSFDRNHADEELGKLRFGFFQHRGTHHIDTQSLRKLNCGSPNKSFQRARDGCTRDTGEDWFFIENARNQSERSLFVDERDRLLNQINLTHEFASQRKLPLFSGEFRKRSKCDLACCNGHGIKRADGLIKLPDTFAVLDIDSEIARFVPDLDYFMASTRQCLLNQFADLSVCANQNNFHENSILISDLRISLFTFNLAGQSASSVEHLPSNPASVGRGEERDYIGDIRRRSQRIVIACHKVPIQSLSLFASITTTSRSLVPSATAAIP